ncbi:MAG: hypothetical protein MI974_05210 [Chitinophagales bacterium]|nr:hypothetical protein [Chitinophagales bacterium]
MMKTIYTLLVAVLCMCSILPAQNLAVWSLTSDEFPTFEDGNVTAEDMTRGNGVASPEFDASGASAYAWEVGGTINSMDYYEFCITPLPGKSLHITGLNFTEQRTHDGILSYQVMWSKDGFETAQTLVDNTVPDDELSRTEQINGLDIRVCDEEEICFRWYGYNAESYDGEWTISNVEMEGSSAASCTPPSLEATNLVVTSAAITSLSLSWSNGNGDGTIIIAQEGKAVASNPCGGETYTANSNFGTGDEIGAGSYVVYIGNAGQATITGLTPGETYFFKAFEYDILDNCYQIDNAPLAAATTLCHNAGAAPTLKYSALNNEAYLAWKEPLCYDEILIVGSESSIASVPTSTDGSDYSANANFGDGEDYSSDFLSTEYPVYQGADNQLTVTGLDNDDTYYFRIYTRWGNTWSVGDEIVLTPKLGCAELNGDVVFINEIHYSNVGGEMDEGVEIAGPSGINLENYVLTFYSADGHIDTDIGSNGNIYLNGMIDNEDDGLGAIWFPIADLRYFGGVVLWNELSGEVIEFISYRIGAFPAYEGIADDMTSNPIPYPYNETLSTPTNLSIQRTGVGLCPGDLVWQGPILASRGNINDGQESILPITLNYFVGDLKGESVLLNWQTATEINNDYMVVEHSMDARHFEEIGRVYGKGNSEEAVDYHLWHDYPQEGTNYYRLRQVDFDGTYAYHGLVAVEYQRGQVELEAYPTVTQGNVTVRLQGVSTPHGSISLVDAFGRVLLQYAVDEETQHGLELYGLPAGQYCLVWQSEDGTRLTNRIIKQ